MINRRYDIGHGTTTVTFSLEEDRPVSVVGDFNRWDPYAHPLRWRPVGVCSVSVSVPSGTQLRFRYLADPGTFFDDPDADTLEPNGYGDTHSVLFTELGRSALCGSCR